MGKSLCKLKKELKTDIRSYTLLVKSPQYVCDKCGRCANKKKNLCSAQKM